MNRPRPPSRKRGNAKKLQNFGHCTQNEQELKARLAQAVRTCEMRRARYIGSKKLRLQAFFTATAINILRACAWLADGTHASTPVSRFARLMASTKSAAAA